jgi:hypothetical protein
MGLTVYNLKALNSKKDVQSYGPYRRKQRVWERRFNTVDKRLLSVDGNEIADGNEKRPSRKLTPMGLAFFSLKTLNPKT